LVHLEFAKRSATGIEQLDAHPCHHTLQTRHLVRPPHPQEDVVEQIRGRTGPELSWLDLRWLDLRWLGLRWLMLRLLGLRWLGLRWLGLRWLELRLDRLLLGLRRNRNRPAIGIRPDCGARHWLAFHPGFPCVLALGGIRGSRRSGQDQGNDQLAKGSSTTRHPLVIGWRLPNP